MSEGHKKKKKRISHGLIATFSKSLACSYCNLCHNLPSVLSPGIDFDSAKFYTGTPWKLIPAKNSISPGLLFSVWCQTGNSNIEPRTLSVGWENIAIDHNTMAGKFLKSEFCSFLFFFLLSLPPTQRESGLSASLLRGRCVAWIL